MRRSLQAGWLANRLIDGINRLIHGANRLIRCLYQPINATNLADPCHYLANVGCQFFGLSTRCVSTAFREVGDAQHRKDIFAKVQRCSVVIVGLENASDKKKNVNCCVKGLDHNEPDNI